jgi:hypothetical protein
MAMQETPGIGCLSTPVEVSLRMLVVKHLYGWSYEATERWLSNSLVSRQFRRIYAAASCVSIRRSRKLITIIPPTAPCSTTASWCSAGRWPKQPECSR